MTIKKNKNKNNLFYLNSCKNFKFDHKKFLHKITIDLQIHQQINRTKILNFNENIKVKKMNNKNN